MNNIRTKIVEDIVQRIKDRDFFWREPRPMPYNPATKSRYTGINNLLLRSTLFKDPRFVTFKQAKEMGYFVKKGETPFDIVRFVEFPISKKIEEDEELLKEVGEKKFVMKRYQVFNVSQLNGFIEPMPEFKYDKERCEMILNAFKATGLGYRVVGGRCYYSPADDAVTMMHPDGFESSEEFNAVLLHELAHATMHPTRLDRTVNVLDKKEYAKEELRAELASAFLYSELGLQFPKDFDLDHAKYIAYYAEILEDSLLEVYKAASAASSISEYCLRIADRYKIRNYDFVKENDSKTGGGNALITPSKEVMLNNLKEKLNKRLTP